MRSQLFQRRFAIVAGKGGVGRTTVAAALGLVAARYGLRTCLVQLHARDDLGALVGSSSRSYSPKRLDPVLPLYGCNLQPAEALREYGLMKLKFRALHNLVFENDVMRRLLRMVPGMNEMLMLGKAWHMEAVERSDERPDGRPAWDLLVVDAPATGHGVSLLRLPQAILDAVPYGPMAEDARAMRALLADPERTALHVVTLPQELPANEALELCDQARAGLGVPTGYLFVNQVLPKVAVDARMLHTARARATTPMQKAVVANMAAYDQWRAQQQVQIQRLRRHAKLPMVELPHQFEPIGRDQVERLGELAEAGMEAADEQHEVAP